MEANVLFNEAIQKLNEANQELFRPEEDVVTYLVCNNAHVAIEKFLKGFLLQNGIDTNKYKTIDTLFEQCKSINKKFEAVNLTGFNCDSDIKGSVYCNDVTKVSRCFDIANRLDTFLRQEKIIL